MGVGVVKQGTVPTPMRPGRFPVLPVHVSMALAVAVALPVQMATSMAIKVVGVGVATPSAVIFPYVVLGTASPPAPAHAGPPPTP